MNDNYFFVDGATLLADVRRIRTDLGLNADAKLRLTAVAPLFVNRLRQFHGGSYRRFVFYFVQDNERLRQAVELPNFVNPREIVDLRVEYCGKRIVEFERAKAWLDGNSAPDYVRDCLYRSEKAVDTQICCDALQLAAMRKLDRLFLYTNDYDFVPLCRTLRQLGCNVNLFRLVAKTVNAELAAECDGLDELNEESVRSCFTIPTASASVPGTAG